MKKNSAPTQREPQEPLLTLKQTSVILNVSIKTVRRRVDGGELPVVRDGRIVRVRPLDLRAYIAVRRFE